MKTAARPIVLPIVLLVILVFVGAPAAAAQTVHFYLGQELNFYIETTQTPNSTVNFTVTQSPAGIVGFSLTAGPYTETLVVPVATNGSGYGVTYFNVKALDVGQTTYGACSPGGCTNNLTFKVATVGSVEITEIDSPITDNPNSGGGKRIYPDRTTPTDTVDRKKVRIVATTDPLVANATIYLKSFDLDDPSANSNPIDANASAGDDNRGSPQAGTLAAVGASGTSNTLTLIADGSGVARADFTVTMQPGDNFMIAASVDEAFLNGLVADGGNLKDAGGNSLPVTKAKASLMLTVWRRVHLEIDSVGNVGTANNATGTITAVTSGTATCTQPIPPPCFTTYTVFQTSDTAMTVDKFANGRIKIGNKTFDVWLNNADQVMLNGVASGINGLVGKSYVLYDDDDYNSDDTAKDGDNSETIQRLPEAFRHLSVEHGSYLDGNPKNVYGAAYVTPQYLWAETTSGYNQANLPFLLNVPDASISGMLDTNRNSASNERADFWVAYFLIAYQGRDAADGDGDTGGVSGTGPVVPSTAMCDCLLSGSCSGGSCSSVPTGVKGSFIFQEAMQDVTRSFFYTKGLVVENKGSTAPHELGHQFGLRGDNLDPITLISTRAPIYNLMDYPNLSSQPAEYTLHPEHINLIRSRVNSPGQ